MTLVVEDVTLLLTSSEAVDVAHSLMMVAHKVQYEAMLAGLFSTLVDRNGRAVFVTRQVLSAYNSWLREIDTAFVPVVDGDVSEVLSGYHQNSVLARARTIRKLTKGPTAVPADAVREENRRQVTN